MALTTATPVGLGAVAMFNVAFGIVISTGHFHLEGIIGLPEEKRFLKPARHSTAWATTRTRNPHFRLSSWSEPLKWHTKIGDSFRERNHSGEKEILPEIS